MFAFMQNRPQSAASSYPTLAQHMATGLRSLGEALAELGIWTAAVIAALPLFASVALGLEADLRSTLLVFESALLVYNFDHWRDAKAGEKASGRLGPGRREFLIVTVLAGLAMTLHAAFESTAVQLVFGSYLAIGMAYGLRLVPRPNSIGTSWIRPKDIPGFKGILVAGAVTLAAVGLPVARAGHVDWQAITGVASVVFAMAAINTHLSDLADLDEDRRSGTPTLAVLLGFSRMRRLSLAVVLLFLAIWVPTCAMLELFSGGTALATILGLGFMGLFAQTLRPNTPDSRYALLLDGSLMIPALVVMFE
jgi:4-hydroxybenzoate polyprenyltransferase